MKNRAQSSLEYMVMLAISLLIFGVILFVSMNMLMGVNSQIAVDAAFRAVEEVKEKTDFIYTHGHPSKITVKVRIPSGIENISMTGNLIKMSISTGQLYTDIYDVTKANITGNNAVESICFEGICREGYYILSIESLEMGYDVNITSV